MKLLIIAMLFSSYAYCAEKLTNPQPPQIIKPIPIFGQKKVADYDPASGKFTLYKDALPEEVYAVLLNQIQQLENNLKQCANLKPKK